MKKIEMYYLVERPVIFGVISSCVLFLLFFAILSLSNSIEHAWQQYLYLWEWMTALIIGFGIQAGLFFYMKGIQQISRIHGSSSKTVVATGGISTGSMVVCCLHHVTDVLPILGVSALAVILSQYQSFILAFGIVSNVLGILFALYTIQKHQLFLKGGLMSKFLTLNMKQILYSGIGLSSIFLMAIFYNQI